MFYVFIVGSHEVMLRRDGGDWEHYSESLILILIKSETAESVYLQLSSIFSKLYDDDWVCEMNVESDI